MTSFSDRTAVITGAGAGIGRGLARALSREGACVGALDLRGDWLDDLSRELQGRPHATAVADVTDAEAVREAVARLEDTLGPTDLLIANAGIIRETSALAFRAEDFAAEVQVNLIGVANSMAAVLPGMTARRSGHLVALSSIASYRGIPPLAGYCASKAGVNALCDAFRAELRPHGVRVTTFCPGFIRTDIAAHMDIPEMPPTLSVEEAVTHMLRVLRKGKAFDTFPARNAWMARLLLYLPRGVSDWMARRSHDRLLASRKRAEAARASPPGATP